MSPECLSPAREVDVQIGQGKINRAFTGSDGTCIHPTPAAGAGNRSHLPAAKTVTNGMRRWRPANKIFKTDMAKLP